MPRWEGDGRERLQSAALELFLEVGYDATTVAAIAKRAGLTERSFYRHFADKREVLFAGDDILIDHVVARLDEALAAQPPYPALLAALAAADEVFISRADARRRVRAISSSAALIERERSKLVALGEAVATMLRKHGAADRDARLLADAGLSILLVASDDRLAGDEAFADLIARAAEDQRLLLDPALSAAS